MSKLKMMALSIVYMLKSTGHSREPCKTPYSESVTLSDRVSLLFTNCVYFANKSMPKYSIPM